MREAFDDLRKGVALAELGGHGDGPYCRVHGAGAALVMLGTYIVDPGDAVPYPAAFVFKPGRANYAGYLREHVPAAKDSGARVGVSVISVALEDTVDVLQAAQEAGADYVSLCAHSSMKMFVRAGLGAALCRRENWDRLAEWAMAILRTSEVPVIVKVGTHKEPDTLQAISRIASAGVPIVHANVHDASPGGEGLAMLRQMKGQCPCLIASGGIQGIHDARRVLEAGADAVAIGTAAMQDPHLCGRIQKLLQCA